MSTQPEQPARPSELLTEITFHYIKSPHFRVVHMDGVWGGATPNGEIHASFFNEKAVLPRSVTFEVNEGALGPEKSRDAPQGLDREIEVEVRMTLAKAISFRNWLDGKIQDLQVREEGSQEAENGGHNEAK